MKWFEKITVKLERLAIPNLTLILVGGSATFFIIGSFNRDILQGLPLVWSKVLSGEVWRLVTFLFYPLDMHPIFAFFTYYLGYIMGTSLEAEWGEAKFNLYVFIACLATVILSSLVPLSPTANGFIFGSIFLAFAYLYPDFTLYLFFVIPIKVKYIAGITWVIYIFSLITENWAVRTLILVSIGNFLLFFGKSILENARVSRFRMESKAKQIKEQNTPFHSCHVCKITEKKDPHINFRICNSCIGGFEYCIDHLNDHTHASR